MGKSEAPKASISIASVPSIQEPILKVETKDEDMIHDSDFEEPSGINFFSHIILLLHSLY